MAISAIKVGLMWGHKPGGVLGCGPIMWILIEIIEEVLGLR